MPRTILVTGSSGFIGQACGRLLESRGDRMVTFDRSDGHDILDRDDLDRTVSEVDGVINLAGQLGTSEMFGHEAAAAAVNIVGALNVADACARHAIPLVQIGTGHRGQPNPYAITKACTEDLMLARWAEQDQQIAVVRAYHAYGPGQKAFPPHGTSTVRKIIPSFACRALTGMPLQINGSGEQVIDLIHVDEVARILIDAIDGPYGVVLEAGTGSPITVTQAARDVIRTCGSESEIEYLDPRPGEPPDAVVVSQRPCSSLPWPYGLDETVDYYAGVVETKAGRPEGAPEEGWMEV